MSAEQNESLRTPVGAEKRTALSRSLGYVLAKDGKPDRARIDAAVDRMKGQLPILDKAVASGHLAAGNFTLADIYLLPILYYLPMFPESRALFEKAGNLTAYYARHQNRPSFENTAPPPPPQR